MTIEGIDRKAAEMIIKLITEQGKDCFDFVFEVQYKHEGQDFYWGSYEPCCLVAGDKDGMRLKWDHNWWDGEDDVIFLKVVPLYEIINFYFERMADPTEYEITCLECRHFENCVDAKRKEGEEFYCYTYEPRYKYLVKAKKYKAGEGPELRSTY